LVGREGDLECRLNLSIKEPVCDGLKLGDQNPPQVDGCSRLDMTEYIEKEDTFHVRSTSVVPT